MESQTQWTWVWVRKGTPLASRVAQGVSGPSSSCVWNPRVFADDARGWQSMGVFLTQGSSPSPCLLHQQVGSLPLSHQRSPGLRLPNKIRNSHKDGVQAGFSSSELRKCSRAGGGRRPHCGVGGLGESSRKPLGLVPPPRAPGRLCLPGEPQPATGKATGHEAQALCHCLLAQDWWLHGPQAWSIPRGGGRTGSHAGSHSHLHAADYTGCILASTVYTAHRCLYWVHPCKW